MKPEIVWHAEKVIKKFIAEWKKDPYLWESEADIHAELYARIKNTLHDNRFRPKPIRYMWEENGKKKEMAKAERFNWIYCEPKTYIGKKHKRTDIVIFKKLGKTYRIKEKENIPMLWACEIKYATEWSSLFPKENIKKDIGKLNCLLTQRNNKIKGADYVCYLVLYRYAQADKRLKKIAWLQEQKKKTQDRRFEFYLEFLNE